MSITITARQLREALEFCNPDGPANDDQEDTEVTIHYVEGRRSDEGEPMAAGLYCWLTEYPEEGCISLFDVALNVAVTAVTSHDILRDAASGPEA